MMFIGLIWGFVKTAFTFLFTKPGIYLLLALAVCASYYGAWHYGEQRGVNDTTMGYETTLAKERALHEAAVAAFAFDHEKVEAALRVQLSAAEKRASEKKMLTKEVTRYVTEKSDAQCSIPYGFVLVHDRALYGVEDALANSGTVNVDSPTGLALSTIATTVNNNYAECELRGQIIGAWQQWYQRNGELFGTMLKAQEKP
jgi:hypothetical protein